MERYRKLGYDVGVNVIANLIAAAILYLLGVWIGLFPPTPRGVLVACLLLSAGVVAALVGADEYIRGEDGPLRIPFYALLVLSGIYGAIATLWLVDNSPLALAMYIVAGLSLLLSIVMKLVMRWLDRTCEVSRADRVDQPPLPGL